MPRHSATVEVLQAAVRVLMVGSRQVTLSVYRQLDYVAPGRITPFGRVRDSRDHYQGVAVVGADFDGQLVRAEIWHDNRGSWDHRDRRWWTASSEYSDSTLEAVYDGWAELPLIVLAGLR